VSGFFLSSEAEADLDSILDYIAADSPGAAVQVLDRFLEVFRMLAKHPDIGHFREDLASRGVRFFPVYSYIVVYASGSRPVEIARILGASQDVESILK
jgi:toxin ParE1/3/4